MGWGDELINSGLARGMAARGELAAFGDRHRIRWSDQSAIIFEGNPNVARLNEYHHGKALVWIESYVGHRPYARMENGRWRFRDFKCVPGEVFLTSDEKAWAMRNVWRIPSDPLIVIEPRVKKFGACDGRNKQWPVERYQQLVTALRWGGEFSHYRIVQFVPPGKRPLLDHCDVIETPTFRHALAVLGLASLYIGPEGGLHHGAAAMGCNAVVIFGGFNTPRSTGYAWHENITVGEPCGTNRYCPHCTRAMASISVDSVLSSALKQLQTKVAA